MVPEAALEASNPLGVLRRLTVGGFTVFQTESFRFCDGINVVVGENGAGKSHLLKLGYAASKALYPAQASKPLAGKEALGKAIADKLVGVFLPDNLGRLCRRGQGNQRGTVSLRFSPPGRKEDRTLSFSFSTKSSSNVVVSEFPELPSSPEGGPICADRRSVARPVAILGERAGRAARGSHGRHTLYREGLRAHLSEDGRRRQS
ncbi:MAG TPA: hypothetical protein VGN75_00440 [Kaistia sp.]|nr:hypothetical protein [Kaistia sp.]